MEEDQFPADDGAPLVSSSRSCSQPVVRWSAYLIPLYTECGCPSSCREIQHPNWATNNSHSITVQLSSSSGRSTLCTRVWFEFSSRNFWPLLPNRTERVSAEYWAEPNSLSVRGSCHVKYHCDEGINRIWWMGFCGSREKHKGECGSSWAKLLYKVWTTRRPTPEMIIIHPGVTQCLSQDKERIHSANVPGSVRRM